MLNNLQQIERHDYEGNWFVGTVVANNDPEKLERVKVTIPGLFEDAEDLLPWVAPVRFGSVPNKPGAHGSFGGVPTVGSVVWVILQDGNPQYPLYSGSPIMKGGPVAEALVNYPNRRGFKDPAGNLYYSDNTPGSNIVTFRHASGTTITVNNDGSVNIAAVATITSSAPQWNHTGNFHLIGDMVHTGDMEHSGNSLHDGNFEIDGVTNINGEINLIGPMEIVGPLSGVGATFSAPVIAPDLQTPGIAFRTHHHDGAYPVGPPIGP